MHPPIQRLSPAAQAAGAQLWERETELLLIEAGIGAVRAGASRILVIEGPAGIGKTQLLLSANRMSQTAGLRILSARATELERDYPFGIARQWLEPVLVGASAAEREALLEGAAGLAARVLGADSGRDPVRIESALHSLYWALANLSSRTPLMLLLDDAQWADGASLRLLTYLAPRMEGLALGTVITSRAPELGEAGALLERLLSDPLAETLHPSALGRQAATEVLLMRRAQNPTPRSSRRLWPPPAATLSI